MIISGRNYMQQICDEFGLKDIKLIQHITIEIPCDGVVQMKITKIMNEKECEFVIKNLKQK